jgi:hypothetical protein
MFSELTKGAVKSLEAQLRIVQEELQVLRSGNIPRAALDSGIVRSGALVGSHADNARHSSRKASGAVTSNLPWASAAVVGVVAAVIASAVATKKKKALTATVSEGAPLVGAPIFA